MTIHVESRAFLRAIDLGGACVERRNAIPVLDRLRVHANGAFVVEGTDLDMETRAEVAYTGSACAPFLLGERGFVRHAVRHAGGDTVTLAIAPDEKLAVESGALSASIARDIPAGDWPEVRPIVEPSFTATLGQRELKLLARVARAMSTEETRYCLNGVYFHSTGPDSIRAVATDGHRMVWADLALPGLTGELGSDAHGTGVIVPRKAIDLLLAKLGRANEVTMAIGPSLAGNAVQPAEGTAPAPIGSPRARFSGQAGEVAFTLTTKTIDGTFPDYARVMRMASSGTAVQFDRTALLRAIRALSFRRPSSIPCLAFEGEGLGQVRVSRRYGDQASAVGVDCVGLWPSKCGFNGDYLATILSLLDCEDVALIFGDAPASDPVTIRDPGDGCFGSLVMPMRV